MLLTIDIGNTAVTIGVFDGERLLTTYRLSTDSRRLSDEYGLQLVGLLNLRGIDPSSIDSACICSGVPPLTVVFSDLCRTFFGVSPLTVSAGVRTGLKILYDTPRDVGADRIADAVAALELYSPPLIVVDLGTATVFDVVNRESEYLGGVISPGISVAADALFFNASQLRRVELAAPRSVVGRNTVNAVQSGLVYGYASLVTGIGRPNQGRNRQGRPGDWHRRPGYGDCRSHRRFSQYKPGPDPHRPSPDLRNEPGKAGQGKELAGQRH